MNDPARPPSSAAAHAQPSLPLSRQPSVASRGSRSSLKRQDPQPPASSSTSPQPQEQQPQPTLPTPPLEPSFAPLFALLTSTSHPSQKPTLHHPTVHYIFADDDPEILTEALARHHHTAEELEGDDPESDQLGSQDGRHDSASDRAILLDLAPAPGGPGSGLEVSWASSLTPDWAVVGAHIARSVDGDDGPSPQPQGTTAHQHQRGAAGTGPLILRVEGVAVEVTPAPPGAPGRDPGQFEGGANRQQQQPAHQRAPSDEYPGLMDEFEKRMGVLRRVVDTGEERQRKTEADPLAGDAATQGDVATEEGDGEEDPRRQSGSD